MEEKMEVKGVSQKEINENDKPCQKDGDGAQTMREDEEVGFSIGADAGW